MFRPLRRSKKEINENDITHLLSTSRRGILAVNGDGGYPYAIPINYYYDKEKQKIYFHSALSGHKSDALKSSDKVCFTVYGNEQILDEPWAPYMQSVVIFGKCHPIEDPAQVLYQVKRFAMKYYPDEATADREITESLHHMAMYEITIEHICGKQIQEK